MARPIPQAPLQRFPSETKEVVVRLWKEDVAKINKSLEALAPSSPLPTIPSPVRGKYFVSEPNITALMRAAIDFRNALIPDGEEKYIQFSSSVSDEKLNADAKDALEMIMIQKIGIEYGKFSCGLASRRTHVSQCEAVVRTACAWKDFLVYKQSSNLWCIRWLAEQKMKSKGRLPVARRVQHFQSTPVNCIPGNLSETVNQENDDIHNFTDPGHQANDFHGREHVNVVIIIRNSSNVPGPAENNSSPAYHGLKREGATQKASPVLDRTSGGHGRALTSMRAAEREHENINQALPPPSSLIFIPARQSPSEADETVRNLHSAENDQPISGTGNLVWLTVSARELENMNPSVRYSTPVHAPACGSSSKDNQTHKNTTHTHICGSWVQARDVGRTEIPLTGPK
ncbi:hypothetical protein BWQ96_00045 [Gracilariopsis chorda]|uniref:Uncharacterized protein n=1 Tax=Gracilariopsis chorda TaxID=448386 RepID=A0A2V3J645_9FLOR|nr:hypothetical protein BWQ96_00045 [Gracilariopsis chorda]|eukprot:PXF49885.1 hypothetical protein BWQ96_00045 [Gracilariopsis chorda]